MPYFLSIAIRSYYAYTKIDYSRREFLVEENIEDFDARTRGKIAFVCFNLDHVRSTTFVCCSSFIRFHSSKKKFKT